MLKFSKKYIFVSLSIVLAIFLCFPMYSCGRKSIRDLTNSVTDTYGRSVKCPKEVNRVATVGSAARIAVYAGAIDKLCAITEMDRPTELRPYTLVDEEKFSTLPTTNDGNHLNNSEVDKEKMLEINPDIIISSRSAEECDQLQEELGIPVLGVYTQDVIFEASLRDAMVVVATACGTEEAANTNIGKINKIYRELFPVCTGNTKSIYRGALNFKGSKGITGTASQFCVHHVLKANSVSNIEGFDGAYDTSLEQILSWNPDYIVLDCTNRDKVKDDMNNHPEIFSKLTAFKNKNVYFSGPFNNNGTNVEYGICEVYLTAKLLYPSVFSNINLEQKYSEIMTILLGKDIYPELKARGIVIGKADL